MIFIDSNLDDGIQHIALCTSSAIWNQRWRGGYVHAHCWVLDAWQLYIVIWHCSVWIFLSCCMFTPYPLTEGRLVKEKQWTTATAIWIWFINVAITIQAPLLEICQEIALKLHSKKAERMYHGTVCHLGTPSRRRKGCSCAEAWNGRSLPGLMCMHQPDYILAKAFSKTVDGIAEENPKCSSMYCNESSKLFPEWL